MGMSVPSALCRLESNVFLFLAEVFWQMGPCFFCKQKQNTRGIENLVLKTELINTLFPSFLIKKLAKKPQILMNKLRPFSLKHLCQPLPLNQNYRNSQMCIESHKNTCDNEEKLKASTFAPCT